MTNIRKYSELPLPDQYSGSIAQGEIEVMVPESGDLPIVYCDRYVSVVEDSVTFPNHKVGKYLRLFNSSELYGDHGIVLIPIWQHRIYLIRLFRHPTRAWELEFPRGFAEIGCSLEENAKRETLEELGVNINGLELLGSVCPNTGLLTTRANVCLVELAAEPKIEKSEAADEAISIYESHTSESLWRKIADGGIRCGFTLSALMLAFARGRLER